MDEKYTKENFKLSYNLLYPFLNTRNEIFCEIIQKDYIGSYKDGYYDLFSSNKKANRCQSIRNGSYLELNNKHLFYKKSYVAVLSYLKKYYNIDAFNKLFEMSLILSKKDHYRIETPKYLIVIFKIFDRQKHSHSCYDKKLPKRFVKSNTGILSYGTLNKSNVIGGIYCPICSGPARGCTTKNYVELINAKRNYSKKQ